MMKLGSSSFGVLVAAVFAATLGMTGWAKVIEHATGVGGLQSVIDAFADVIRLLPGEHTGPVKIEKTLTLEGEEGAVLRGPGKGSVITVAGLKPSFAVLKFGDGAPTCSRWTPAFSLRRRRREPVSRKTR